MTSAFTFQRLENGPAVGLVNTPADLPAYPFSGLRLNDFANVLSPRGTWELKPKATLVIVTQVLAGDRHDWEWVQLDGGGGSSGTTSSQTLMGAGPFVLDGTVADVVRIVPPHDGVVEVSLPSVMAVADGRTVTFVVIGTALGAAVAVLLASAGQTAGPAGRTALRVYEAGSYQLRADRATLCWEQLAARDGVPQQISIFADNAGDDLGPGTFTRPIRRVAASLGLLVDWSGSATLSLPDLYLDDAVPDLVIPFSQRGGAPFGILGSIQTVAAFGTTTITNANGEFGDPYTPANAIFDPNPLFDADAAAGFFAFFTSGSAGNTLIPIAASGDTLVEFSGYTGATPNTGDAFIVQAPRATINGFAASGGPLALDSVLVTGTLTITATQVTSQFCDLPTVVLGDCASLNSFSTTIRVMINNSARASFTQCNVDFLRLTASASADVTGCRIGDALSSGTQVERSSDLSIQSCLLTTMVVVQSGSSAEISSAQSRSPAAGLQLESGGTAHLTQFSGTVGTTGVLLAPGVASHVTVDDPTTGTTGTCVAGTAEVRVGTLGAKTWTQINAGAPADCLELTGAGASGSSVTKSAL